MRDADPSLIQELAAQVFPHSTRLIVERVAVGVSTRVYRIRTGHDVFYPRILPEVGASFAPEVRVHQILREQGVKVPEVIYLEHCNEALGRSIVITTEIAGSHSGHRRLDDDTRRILIEAGRDLAIINTVPVDGFGWIRRDRRAVTHLEAEHPTYRAFALDNLEEHLAILAEHVLGEREIAAIRRIVEHHDAFLDVEHACLAHGDFDVTHIFQDRGRYTGIIDFGEIRGADRFYDLGHFMLHEGETLPFPALPPLLQGYREMTELPPNYEERVNFSSMLIALHAVARSLHKSPHGAQNHVGIGAIRRAIQVL